MQTSGPCLTRRAPSSGSLFSFASRHVYSLPPSSLSRPSRRGISSEVRYPGSVFHLIVTTTAFTLCFATNMRATTSVLLALGVVFLFARLASAISTPQLCYSDIDKLAPDYIAPCWTSNKTPHYSCCKAGNKCLKHNACYDGETGVTYQYGCTDPTFKDEHCPQKCNLDRDISRWVGLVYCDGQNGMPDKTWVCCIDLCENHAFADDETDLPSSG
jgi:hypothetical protein